ncbi:unnamed protein product, partial [Discosporangium mesarthrocarpum]
MYRKLLEKLSFQFLVLSLALYSPAGLAQSETLAGRVVATRGTVTALDPAGTSRSLARRSEIYVGDTVVTDAASFAQIRMTDSAIVSLKETTQFEIVAYTYEENPNTDESTMRLIEGGFRTITGTIGTNNREAVNVETEFATI